MYELAERLGQHLATILDMTVAEFDHWWTFFKVKREKMDGDNKRNSPSKNINR